MQNRLSLLLTTAFGLLLCGCTMENPLLDHSLRTADNQCLRTEEAQRIYNDYLSSHSTRNDSEDMIFFKGDDAVRYGTKPRRPPNGRCQAVDVELVRLLSACRNPKRQKRRTVLRYHTFENRRDEVARNRRKRGLSASIHPRQIRIGFIGLRIELRTAARFQRTGILFDASTENPSPRHVSATDKSRTKYFWATPPWQRKRGFFDSTL